MAYGRLRNRQFKRPCVLAFQIDGSEVGTSDSEAGLTIGSHIAKIRKGSGTDSNLVTLTLNRPLGLPAYALFQEITVDCVARLEAAPTVNGLQIRTLRLDGVTKQDDADLNVFLFSTEYGESAEGWTY